MSVNGPLLQLTSEDCYRSDTNRGHPLARRMPTAMFYLQVFGVVLDAAKFAKKGRYDSRRWIASSIRIVRALESVGVPLCLENLHSFRDIGQSCVFIANHMSVLETFVLPCLIEPHRRVTFVVKQSLVDYPLFKHVMLSRNPVVVGRTNPRKDLRTVLQEGAKRLENDISVVIFPQTTRSVEFEPQKFNSLGIKLAGRTNAPVVPVALKTDAWSLGKHVKDCGPIYPSRTVHIRFGQPFEVTGTGRAEHARVIDFISSALARWKSEGCERTQLRRFTPANRRLR